MPAWRTSWNRSWRSGSHDGVVLLDHEPGIAVAGGDVLDEGSEACGAGCQIGPVATRGVVDGGLDLHCGQSRDDDPPTARLLVLHVDPPLTWQHESTHGLTDGLGVADCHGGDDIARPFGLVDEDVATHARRARTGLGCQARCTARYTVERATENSSASSALVCVPARQSSTRCASWAGLSLGCLPRSRPLALATFMPSLVRILIKSDSNSAIIPRTLYSSRPTGSVGSCTEPPMFSPNLRRSGRREVPVNCGFVVRGEVCSVDGGSVGVR